MKLHDKFEIICFFLSLFPFAFFISGIFVCGQKIGPMLEQEQYMEFGTYCVLFGAFIATLSSLILPIFVRTFAFFIKKVKNGNPKAEKGEKGIENGTDDFNRI